MRPRSACQIVDLYHAKEHLWDVSRALHGGNTECVEEWAEAHCTDLVKGRLDDFLADLCVGSGVGEAGCKTVIGTRSKWSGMHWTVAGANAVIALSCCKLSGRYEDFWVYRSAHS